MDETRHPQVSASDVRIPGPDDEPWQGPDQLTASEIAHWFFELDPDWCDDCKGDRRHSPRFESFRLRVNRAFSTEDISLSRRPDGALARSGAILDGFPPDVVHLGIGEPLASRRSVAVWAAQHNLGTPRFLAGLQTPKPEPSSEPSIGPGPLVGHQWPGSDGLPDWLKHRIELVNSLYHQGFEGKKRPDWFEKGYVAGTWFNKQPRGHCIKTEVQRLALYYLAKPPEED